MAETIPKFKKFLEIVYFWKAVQGTNVMTLFHFAAGEAGLEGFFLGDAEIDQLGFGTYRAVGVIDLGVDEGHVAHHVVDAGADGYQVQLGGDGLEVLDVHLGGHSGGL